MLEFLSQRHVIACKDELDWLRARQQFVTASEAGALSTPPCAKHHSRFSLFHSKRREIESIPAQIHDTPAGQARLYGHASEPMTALVHATLTGRTLHNLGEYVIIGDGAPGERSILSCSPDYLIDPAPALPHGHPAEMGPWHPTPEDGPGICQIKNVRGIEYAREWEVDGPPAWILLQTQVEMWCAGVTWGTIAITVSGCRHWFLDQQLRPDLVARIRREAELFLFDVAAGNEPEPDGSDTTEDTLKDLFDDRNDTVLLLPSEATERWSRMREAAENAKRWGAIEKGEKNWFRQIMAENQHAIIPEVGQINNVGIMAFPKVANVNKARSLAAKAGLL